MQTKGETLVRVASPNRKHLSLCSTQGHLRLRVNCTYWALLHFFVPRQKVLCFASKSLELKAKKKSSRFENCFLYHSCPGFAKNYKTSPRQFLDRHLVTRLRSPPIRSPRRPQPPPRVLKLQILGFSQYITKAPRKAHHFPTHLTSLEPEKNQVHSCTSPKPLVAVSSPTPPTE